MDITSNIQRRVPHRKGRGAIGNPTGRYESRHVVALDDGWTEADGTPPVLTTTLTRDHARTIITHNRSPDIPFSQSINPYRGCEHGCVYCFARPTHAYLGLSPGLDFESRLFYKPDAAELLTRELGRPGYHCEPIALGTNTDVYQPVERRLALTRRILCVLQATGHPAWIVTKAVLIERDLDILSDMARRHLVGVWLSITTLEHDLARRLEPRASAPTRRLETLSRLAAAGIPVGVMFAPVIPAVNDNEMEKVLSTCRDAGAQFAAYTLLRLPHEVQGLFETWLETHLPLRAKRVMGLVRNTRRGMVNVARFGERMRGHGAYANMLGQRFQVNCKRVGLARQGPSLDCGQFRAPHIDPQLSLF